LDSLDLYATIEPYIGFYEEYEALYTLYLTLLKPLHVKNVLDVGCGNGKFLKHLENSGYDSLGIERSQQMVTRALELGVNAKVLDIEKIEDESFDAIVAIGDVLNYIPPKELDDFFLHIKRVLKKEGYFLADVNTLEGFEVADGVMTNSSEEGFLAIEANFENNLLRTEINFFEKKDTLYKKHTAEVVQYFHPKKYFKTQKLLKLKNSFYHSMFSDANEKEIFVLQRS
jgi:SAM-dependent methyltransferase